MKSGGKVIHTVMPLLLVGGIGLSCAKAFYKAPATATKTKSHGPPPHAPAHGYRAKTSEGLAIAYDSKLEVYVLVGLSNHYYYKGLYYRLDGHGWEVSAKLHGSWQAVAEHKMPLTLRSGKKSKGKGKGKGREKRKG
jgi:hypothetical protein